MDFEPFDIELEEPELDLDFDEEEEPLAYEEEDTIDYFPDIVAIPDDAYGDQMI